jgi:hypothetical protein
MRLKTCKACGNKFEPAKPAQAVCDWNCAIKHTASLKAKRERKETKERKAKLKTRRDWLREAQAVVNKFRRLEDTKKGYPCISCGRHHQGQYHAGHYRSTKAAPELRFDPRNIHLQCQPCNTHLSGNILGYRKGLIDRYGMSLVDYLEGPHEAKHYTIDELKAIKKEYSDMAKLLAKSD